jgi:Berberine and berberine like
MGVEDTGTQVVRTAYRPADFARLAELKAHYDPANIFRVNFNIPRTGSTEESSEDRNRTARRGAGRGHDDAGAMGSQE